MTRLYLTLPLVLLVGACGGNSTSRVHEKTRTPSDIKISHLDVENKTINLRFNYRTYRERKLLQVDCGIEFSQGGKLHLLKQFDIQLGAFSTEVLSIEYFNTDGLVEDAQSLSYSLECEMDYDKGKEYLFTDSVLHRVPSSNFLYR